VFESFAHAPQTDQVYQEQTQYVLTYKRQDLGPVASLGAPKQQSNKEL